MHVSGRPNNPLNEYILILTIYLEEKRAKILEEKQEFLSTLSESKENVSNLVEFLKYSLMLRYNEIPDYDYLDNLLSDEFEEPIVL